MKTILVNRKPVIGPWGGGNNFVTAFYEGAERNGFKIVNQFATNIDAILMIDPRYDELGISSKEAIAFKKAFSHVKLIYRVNECDARKAEKNIIDPLVQELDLKSDLTIFISNWLLRYHRGMNHKIENGHVILNGANRSIFNEKQKIQNGKINIVTHHWSSNFMKGTDVYGMIDAWLKYHTDYTFTYIGRSSNAFRNSIIIPPLSGKSLADLLGSYDVYISGSRFDPGPNHIAESLACNLPTYAHIDGGGAVEMVGDDHVYNDLMQLIKILESKHFSKNETSNQIREWSVVVDDYYKRIREIL